MAGWVHGVLLPFVQEPSSSGRFEFFFSHLLAFSLVPSFLLGLINARFKHIAAEYVWLVPAAILVYKIATYPVVSVLDNQYSYSAAFHHYFAGGFRIPEFQDWHDFWSIVGSNPDMLRGTAQLQFTAPFYAGIAYSTAVYLGRRTDINRKLTDRIKKWEATRFGQDEPRPNNEIHRNAFSKIDEMVDSSTSPDEL